MMKVVLMTMIHLIMADRSGWDAFALSGLVRLQAFDGADWTYEAVGDGDHVNGNIFWRWWWRRQLHFHFFPFSASKQKLLKSTNFAAKIKAKKKDIKSLRH